MEHFHSAINIKQMFWFVKPRLKELTVTISACTQGGKVV